MSIKFDCSSKTPLTEGGEGVIYEFNDQIIKIYKKNVNLQSKERKVKLLINKSLPAEVIAPTDIVVDRNGKFSGYAMNKVEGEELKKLINKKFITSNNISSKDILTMLVKSQRIIEELHKNNIYIGDLNDQNILFDKQFNVYFIDCDSWTVDNEKCEVAMDLFRDPLLNSNNFNRETDIYSFAVLTWKLLTRIHPFGGTMNPDMSIVERMKKGLSVIGNPNVTIPRTIKTWKNLSPSLVHTLKCIFDSNSRMIKTELSDLLNDLKFCQKDKEFYYGKYTKCPICDSDAKVQAKPISKGVMSGLKLFTILDTRKVKTVLNEYTYLDVNDNINDSRNSKSIKHQYGVKYYFTSEGYLIEDYLDKFVVYSGKEYHIEKKYKTQIVVEDKQIYYISKQNTFVNMTVLAQGNSLKNICKCSNNAYFEVSKGQYLVVNHYYGKVIVNNNGTNFELNYNSDINNYGIHYDLLTNKWLVVFENNAGQHTTFVISETNTEYTNDQIKYACDLGGLCLNNSVIFIPTDGKIRGYSYKKTVFKDFECSIVNDSSKLIKNGNKFTIINDENIYSLS